MCAHGHDAAIGPQWVISVDELLRQRSVFVVVGSGGVGKTTSAAALGLRAAELGRRAVVVTVDPARRLADALGLVEGLSAEPELVTSRGDGEMWASMLDPRTTFDRLIAEQSSNDELTEQIQANHMYGNLAGGLSGTHEYLATEELFALHKDGRFDVVIVDTPPSRHALDIVDAPVRLVTLFENRIYQLLTGHTTGLGRLIAKSAQRFVKTVASVVGADVVEDAIEFFTLLESLEGGFRDRAVAVHDLLTGPDTAVVLVAAPRPDVVRTGLDLTSALAERSMAPEAVVINLLHPDPSADLPSIAHEELLLGPPGSAAARLARRSDHERAAIKPLIAAVGSAVVVEVPILADGIHDRDGLTHVVTHLATP